MKAELAFHKARRGSLIDWLISLWTWSKYSHVELIMEGEWYGTSPSLMKVRKTVNTRSSKRWDFVEVEVDKDKVLKLFKETEGAKYDWKGIFMSQFLPLHQENKKKWFCSEWCAEALGYNDSHEYSPKDLYRKVKGKK